MTLATRQIRLKRLERLRQSAPQEPSTSPSTSKPTPSSHSPSSSRPSTSAAVSAPSTSASGSNGINGTSTSKASSKIEGINVSRTSTPAKKATPVSTPQTKPTPSTSSNKNAASTSAKAAQPSIPYPQWLSATISRILQVTLSQARAENSNWSITYLYSLHDELMEELEGSDTENALRFNEDNLERAIVARLSMSPDQMEDLETESNPVVLTVLASLPAEMTNLEYLVSCWRRWGTERARLGSPKEQSDEYKKQLQALEFIKQKLMEGIGLQLQEPELFPQPSGCVNISFHAYSTACLVGHLANTDIPLITGRYWEAMKSFLLYCSCLVYLSHPSSHWINTKLSRY